MISFVQLSLPMSFPQYYQQDSRDCGPSCLRMIARFYGKDYSAEEIRGKCFSSREGVSLLDISEAAESIGFRTIGVKITWEQFRDQLPFPAIVHWNHNHFVVVYDLIKRRHRIWIRVADPALGLIDYSEEDFLNSWSYSQDSARGIALILQPAPEFKTTGKEEPVRRYGFTKIIEYLRPYKTFVVQIFLAMVLSGLISLVLPFITQSVVDKGIATSDLSLIVILLIAQLFLVIGGMANNLIRGWLMLHTTTRLSVSLISDFICKLLKLPISFFENRTVGDIMQRMGDYSRIQSFLTGALLSMLVAVVSLIVYSIVMTGYSLAVLSVFLVGSLCYILWVLLFMKKRKKLDKLRFQQSAASQSNIVQLVAGVHDIKLNNCERKKRWEWEGIQANLFKINVKTLSLSQIQEAGGVCIDQVKNVLISFIAAKSVIEGYMTLGMMMALQYIVGQVNAPISQFIHFIQSAQDASISMERLGEIHGLEDEESENGDKISDIPTHSGIEFTQVVFQYDGPDSPKVIDQLTLSVPPGKVTAVVGASGSGKTTLLKLVQGFYRPSAGEICVGGVPLEKYNIRKWRDKCGSVMQESFIFSDSIAANIALSEDRPDMERVRLAAQTANLSEWVDGLPLRYETRVGPDGHGLSTGQKQRLLIARAIYKDADYCFLDEATNSLDAFNERDIMSKVYSLFKGKTVIIVAHRLSTVKNADNIVVLNKGTIVEQGTHEYLLSLRGQYYSLIQNQLEYSK